MSQLIHYPVCPVCSSTKIKFDLYAKDFTVSSEMFAIWHCDDCSLRFTQDVPAADDIFRYYQSDDYISHSDTEKGFINRLYHRVRKKTLKEKRKLIQQQTSISNGQLLDVGCGTGAFLHEIQQAGWQVTGLEPDAGARKKANDLYNLRVNELDELGRLEKEKFDAITLWHVLEHVHDLHTCIEQLKTLLKPSGRLFIAVPNYTSQDAAAYGPFWAAYDVPRHLYHFSPQAMNRLLEKHGMKIILHRAMWYDSFYISMLSSKYKNKGTNFFGAGWTGFISNLRALFNVKRCSSVIYIITK